jgi:hypothetical protein
MNRIALNLFASAIVLLLLPLSVSLAQETEPEEPEIVLPRVILEIEDLSVETITAGIPEDELVPREFDVPLPEPEDLVIGEPSIMLSPPRAESPVLAREEGKYLNFEGVIGVGSRNNFMSGFSLYQFEREPEGKLVFAHEIYDGLSGFEEGAGYNLREDSLEGLIRFDVRKLDVELEGAFNDYERGLQGLGSYYSKISRHGNASGSLRYPFGERFSLGYSLGADLTSQLLTAAGSTAPDPDKTNEYLVYTSLDGRYRFNRGYVGLEPGASYRDGADGAYQLTRTRIKGYFGVDLGEVTRLEGDVSWFWSESSGNLFPFTLTLATYPTDLFSLNLSAGYRLLEYNLNYLFSSYPYAESPVAIRDDYGWFFEAGSHIHVARAWVLNAGLSFMDASGMLTTTDVTDPLTGLFPVTQTEAQRLTSELGIRWNQSMRFSAYASWIYDILDRPRFFPQHSLNLELNWNGRSGRYGADLTSVQEIGVNDFVQAPIVDLSAYYRIADFIRIVGEANDILYPALNKSRFDWFPFVDVGLQFAFKVYINF